MDKCLFTKKRRRQTCVHEAGHAIVHSLGGAMIYRLAVAPEGNDGTWTIEGRKGGTLTNLVGVCQPSDFCLMDSHLHWDDDKCLWHADRAGLTNLLRQIGSLLGKNSNLCARRYVAESRRIVRAHVCGSLAGPAAEQIFLDDGFTCLDEPYDWCNPVDDIVIAQARAELLPYRNEYWHACRETEAVLRRPDIWAYVLRLAD